MSESNTEVQVEEAVDKSSVTETEAVIPDDQGEVVVGETEIDDESMTTTDAPEVSENAVTTTDSTETQGVDEDEAEKKPAPEFMQFLDKIGIDVKKHEGKLQKFAEMCDMLGVIDFINNPDNSPEEIEAFVQEALVGAEDNREEALKKIAMISGLVLEGLSNLGDFASESTKDFLEGGIGRLIDALIRGAGYNSAGSMSKYESENPGKVVGSDEFFKLMREDSTKAIGGLLENKSDLKKAGWDIGDKGWEMLDKGKGDSRLAKEALLAIFVGENQSGVTSLAEQLNSRVDHNKFWEDVSPVLAKIFGGEKNTISLDIKDLLQKMGTGDRAATDNSYFGKTQ